MDHRLLSLNGLDPDRRMFVYQVRVQCLISSSYLASTENLGNIEYMVFCIREKRNERDARAIHDIYTGSFRKHKT